MQENTPIPLRVGYQFQFNNPKPLPGMTFLMWGEIWIEDVETHHVVDGYTFDAPLTPGVREVAFGRFTWEAIVKRPGWYIIRHQLRYRDPLGQWRDDSGGGRRVSIGLSDSSQ